MTTSQLLLENNPTLLDVSLSLEYLIKDYERLIDKLNKDIDFKNSLLGEKVEKIYSKNMEGQLRVAKPDENADYVILNQNIKLETQTLTTTDETIATNKQIKQHLDNNFIKQNDVIVYNDIQD